MGTSDPLQQKYLDISPYAYCAGDPVNLVDVDGRVIETAWDIANVLYDVGSAIYYTAKGDKESTKSAYINLGADAVAVILPGVPAGLTKLAKTPKLAKTGAKLLKAENNGLKNAKAVQEGIEFGNDKLKEVLNSGQKATGRVRLVPKNGRGNVKGNRTDTDILIKNGDGSYTIIETKLLGIKPKHEIEVKEYIRINKYG